MERGMNALQRSYKMCIFTLTVSLQYLIKTKNIKRHILKSILTVFYCSAARMRLSGKWPVFYKLLENSLSSLLAENLLH